MDGYYRSIIQYIKEHKPNKHKLSTEKTILSKKYKMPFTPSDIEILVRADEQDITFLKQYLSIKPVRTISGVAVIAIMTKPNRCPHGKCTMCPGGVGSVFGDTPQSYTGNEPASMRAARNQFDSYLQVFNRLEQYVLIGQNPDKVELIIMGGTFLAMAKGYQEGFVYYAFKAMNDFSKMFYKNGELDLRTFKEFFELPGAVGDQERAEKIRSKLLVMKENGKRSLEEEQVENETSIIRCIGLTIETKPDWAKLEHANMMLRLGCTRVELGVQSVYDEALDKINRGHSVQDSIEATQILKDTAFKINYHLMLGLPGIEYDRDIEGLKQIFSSPGFRPDMLKVYPCMVFKGTELFKDWEEGKFTPLTTEQAAKLIIEFKKYIPEYVRVMRVQRDIPTKMIESGVDRTNLRQMIEETMKKEGLTCRCIRCREIKRKEVSEEPHIKVQEYDASGGKEFFISVEADDHIIGFCRLRLPSQSLRPEISLKSGLIRELHVYGTAVKIGSQGEVQHKGFGKQLMHMAEALAKEHGMNKMVVISGVGVREYYRKLGYEKEGPYMVKAL